MTTPPKIAKARGRSVPPYDAEFVRSILDYNPQNEANKTTPSHNTSGFKGVCFDKSRQLFMAHITIGGRFKFLGYSSTAEGAAELYRLAAESHFGTFARVG